MTRVNRSPLQIPSFDEAEPRRFIQAESSHALSGRMSAGPGIDRLARRSPSPFDASAWPAARPCVIEREGLLCDGRVFLPEASLRHIHAHTLELASRLRVQEHGVFDVSPAVMRHYGNFNHLVLNLAAYALDEAREGRAFRDSTQGARQRIVCRVFGDDDAHSLGHVSHPSADSLRVHTRFNLKHIFIVLDEDRARPGVLNLTTAYPVRV